MDNLALDDVEANNNDLIPQPLEGSVVSFHDLSYTIPMRTKPCCCGKKIDKKILQSVNGIMKSGMNAILGPTGSGKSSILDVLAGRKDPQFVKGNVLIDGHKQPSNFKCMAGYVVQDDIVTGTLTVRENIFFSANLRLPAYFSRYEKETRVDQVIQDLNLTRCANTKIGTPFIRGVSGGERKRTSIGMELISLPSVLFLDEPTTGLDASTANLVMMLLHKLSRRGKTIIFSIHQPRYSIYKLFDTITLLNQGRLIYGGPAEDALAYFEDKGYVCEKHNNPPDFFLDIVTGDLMPTERDSSSQLTHSKTNRNGISNGHLMEYEKKPDIGQELVESFLNSPQFKATLDEINPILEGLEQRIRNKTEVPLKPVDYATSFCHQIGVLSKRFISNLFRNPQTSILQYIVMIFLGLVVGVIFLQLKLDPKGVGNRVGASFFIIMNMIFGNLSAIELFINERASFIHENSSGYYRVSVYFCAKIICDILPMRTIPTIFYSIITYFMVGFQTTAANFFLYLAILVSTTISGAMLAFCISSGIGIYAIANMLVAMCFVIMMVFSGFFINLTSLGDWISWIKYFSIFRYSISLLSINELKDLKFCANSTMDTSLCDLPLGNNYLDTQGIQYKTNWDFGQNFVALWGIIGVLLIFSYIQLRRMNKYK